MITTILVGVGALLLLILLIVLIYRSSRTFDASPNHTYVVQSEGEIAGALREPATLWDPKMSVLRDKNAPDIAFPAQRPQTGEYYMRSLVNKRTGRFSLTVNTCTPRPFRSMTLDRHTMEITANVVFRIDIERIHIPSQLENFGATLSNRIENLFDNEISKLRDEEVRGKQFEIETAVTRSLRDIEEQVDDDEMMAGMPLGIKVYEANFSFREVDLAAEAQIAASGDGSRPSGPLWVDVTHIDRLADTLEHRTPEVRDAVMRLIELQTRQNVIELMCKSGGLVAFTAKELGLSDLATEIAGDRNGHNRMQPRSTSHDEDDDVIISETETSQDASSSSAGSQNVQRDYYGRPIPPQSETVQQSASQTSSSAHNRSKQQG